MWGNKSKSKAKGRRKVSRVDSLIGQHSEILGGLRFSGGLHCDGTVRGSVTADEDDSSVLTLSDRGVIEGEVRVPFMVINGVVMGDVFSARHIELASNARIEGDVHYNLLEMAMGAEVNGRLVHTGEEARAPLALGATGEELDELPVMRGGETADEAQAALDGAAVEREPEDGAPRR